MKLGSKTYQFSIKVGEFYLQVSWCVGAVTCDRIGLFQNLLCMTSRQGLQTSRIAYFACSDRYVVWTISTQIATGTAESLLHAYFFSQWVGLITTSEDVTSRMVHGEQSEPRDYDDKLYPCHAILKANEGAVDTTFSIMFCKVVTSILVAISSPVITYFKHQYSLCCIHMCSFKTYWRFVIIWCKVTGWNWRSYTISTVNFKHGWPTSMSHRQQCSWRKGLVPKLRTKGR